MYSEKDGKRGEKLLRIIVGELVGKVLELQSLQTTMGCHLRLFGMYVKVKSFLTTNVSAWNL